MVDSESVLYIYRFRPEKGPKLLWTLRENSIVCVVTFYIKTSLVKASNGS